MNKKKLKELIEQRLEEIREINAQAERGQQTVVLDQSRVGRLSRMDAMQAQEMNKEGQRRRDLEKQRLEEALIRIDEADYGECEECGNWISEGRLSVDPAAAHCIGCASKLEQL
ncbi:MAG: DnaK suppressor protein [Saprospiraceae bacterium]|jgi:DnaK suppressor protein